MGLNVDLKNIDLKKLNINWQQLEKVPVKIRAAVVGGLCVLIAVLFVYFVYLPMQKQIAGLNEQLVTAQRNYNEKKAIADNLPTFQEEVRRLNERLALALTKLPNTTEIDRILVDVPNLAKEEELVVTRFNPGREMPKDFYSVVPLQLQLKGSYGRLAKFFEKVSKLNRIISVGDVSFEGPDTRPDGQVLLSASVQASTYTFLGKAPVDDKGAKK